MPSSKVWSYSPVKARSVPFCCVTLYCSGVSVLRSSSSLGLVHGFCAGCFAGSADLFSFFISPPCSWVASVWPSFVRVQAPTTTAAPISRPTSTNAAMRLFISTPVAVERRPQLTSIRGPMFHGLSRLSGDIVEDVDRALELVVRGREAQSEVAVSVAARGARDHQELAFYAGLNKPLCVHSLGQVREHIERAARLHDAVLVLQPFEHEVALGAVLLTMPAEILVEAFQRGPLQRRRRAHITELLQAVHTLHHIARGQQPADAPAGHAHAL